MRSAAARNASVLPTPYDTVAAGISCRCLLRVRKESDRRLQQRSADARGGAARAIKRYGA